MAGSSAAGRFKHIAKMKKIGAVKAVKVAKHFGMRGQSLNDRFSRLINTKVSDSERKMIYNKTKNMTPAQVISEPAVTRVIQRVIRSTSPARAVNLQNRGAKIVTDKAVEKNEKNEMLKLIIPGAIALLIAVVK